METEKSGKKVYEIVGNFLEWAQNPRPHNFRNAPLLCTLTLNLTPNYPAGNWNAMVGQEWIPLCCGAKIYKGGELIDDLSSYMKFARQSNHFWRCLGSHFVLENISPPPSGRDTSISPEAVMFPFTAVFNGNGNNILSFLDRNLAETNAAASGAQTKVALLGSPDLCPLFAPQRAADGAGTGPCSGNQGPDSSGPSVV